MANTLNEIRDLVVEQGAAFKQFKNQQNQRLDALEEELGHLETEQEKASLGGGGGKRRDSQYTAMVLDYLRSGDDRRIRDLQPQGRLSYADDTAGGVLLSEELSKDIYTSLESEVAIRRLARTGVMSGSTWRKVIRKTNAGASLVQPGESRDATSDPEYAWLTFPAHTAYSLISVDAELLDDAAADLGQDLIAGIVDAFSELEDTQFVTGTGEPNQLGGILGAYDIVANASQSWSSIGYVATGDATGFPSTDPGNPIIDLIYALPSKYHRRATFLMNRSTFGELSKLQDDSGRYLMTPEWSGGKQSMTLRGFPVALSDSMPDLGADEYPVALADFTRAFMIRDREGIRVLRDPYTTKGAMKFYVTRRLAAGVMDFNAIKLLKCEA